MTDEMDQVVTKRALDDGLGMLRHELHATRDDLSGAIAAVRRELHEVRDDLKRDVAAVRHELHEVRDDLKRDVAAVRHELHEVRDDLHELNREVAERPTRSEMLVLFEDFASQMRVMFDPYRDLPPRTSRLERAVFGPPDPVPSASRKRTPKRRKRAA